ncbi:RCC1 domain-containing protein [Hymenobacter baengnokdamensis]|uniref:RCC1 domain-containing protein n=1 Tax=Hymenobacter baengnokdamensis TaxID=2615203 RepID=UPI001244A0CA|nr:RCC1 repeat-containing protein [Hymenobacter baengnokdamensis]
MTTFSCWLVATLRQCFLGRPVGLAVLLLVSLVSQAGLPSARRLPPNGQLAAGSAHSLLVRPDGSLYAWGANGSGQLGNGSTTTSSTPVAVSSGAMPTGTRLVQVAAGKLFSLALAADGTAYAWGDNASGQLGNSTTASSQVPVAVSLPTGGRFVQVAAGQLHALALAADGSLYAWGGNTSGQLGNGTTAPSTIPVSVSQGAAPAGTRFVQVAAGATHSLALATDGTLYAWGDNTSGQLGNTSNTSSSTPVAVSQGAAPAGTRFVQVAAGQGFSLALAADGTVYAWGLNSAGQLGTTTPASSNAPLAAAMPAGTRFVQVAAGAMHSLALAADGSLYAWGDNASGQLGTNNAPTGSPVPVAVSQGAAPAGLLFGQVAAGSQAAHSLALAADGMPYAWGTNGSGQLGSGSTTLATTPVAVAGLVQPRGYVQAAVGSRHTVAVQASGVLGAWGSNTHGELGNGTTNSTANSTPVAVGQGAMPAGTRLVQVAAGDFTTIALSASGTAYTWGYNNFGQLGNGSTTSSSTPGAVSQGAMPTGTRLVQVAAGPSHMLALAADGTAYAWGSNSSGQLGNGTTTTSSTPVAVSLPAGVRLVQVAVGSSYSLALAADGTAYAWGLNSSGYLGNGSTTSSSTPVAVSQGAMPTGTRLVQIAAGNYHAVALAADGTTYAWGQNIYGQLGNGTTTTSTTPVAVSQGALPAGTRLVQVMANNYISQALAADGRLYTWGYNTYGQLGINSTTNSTTPAAEYSGLTQWRGLAVGPGANHALVLGQSAAVFMAGYNSLGQLGDGTTTNSLVYIRNQAPLPVVLTAFTATAAGPAAVRLAWATASEKSSDFFEVERSPDGTSFARIGTLAAAGSSSSPHHYELLDAALPAGAGTAYYRLRQVDIDGTLSYSPVRVVTLAAQAGLALYPNPATAPGATLRGALPGTVVMMYDALGRLVASAPADAAGTAALALPTGLPAGVYVVRAGAHALRLAVE